MKIKLLILVFLPIWTLAQNIRDTSIFTPLFNLSYAYQLPGADLANSYGANSNIGFSGGIKSANNWLFELNGTFFFGKDVRDTMILDNLITSDNYILDQYGNYANVLVFERGWTATANIGKLFPVIGPNPNSGIVAKFGIGMMRHKIRIDVKDNLVPALQIDKLPFYDRLTLGMTLRQYIGYQHLSNNHLTNFNIGFEFYQGFTQGMRDYQIDLMGPYRSYRFELMYGIRVGWIVPVYRRAPNEFYIN